MAAPHIAAGGGDLELAIRENALIRFPVHESSKSRFSGKIQYWWGWFVAAVLLLGMGIPALLLFGLINKKMWIYPICRFGAESWLKACGARVVVRGGEDLPRDESFVFISNHRSYLDTATLFFFTGRRIGLVAKKELLKVPVFGQGMHYVNIFSIDRSNPERARRSMEKARKVIERGSSFGVFVEGTRAMPGELLPFKKGAFHLAMQTGARVVPVAIKNTDWMMGKRTGVAYAGTIEMVLLPPVDIEGKSMEELIIETRRAMARELAMPSMLAG